MKISSHRHLNRMRRLGELIKEAGSASALATHVGTPKTHISALMAGRRGIGDVLAAKLERKYEKPEGWMDHPPGSTRAVAELAQRMEEKLSSIGAMMEEMREMQAADEKSGADQLNSIGGKPQEVMRASSHGVRALQDPGRPKAVVKASRKNKEL